MGGMLVIEGNPASMKLTSLILTNAGRNVSGAVDAASGLRLARDAQPDLVLMDIQLPGMDGLNATALLKGAPAAANIQVIVLSALSTRASEEQSETADIVKPLRYRELYEVIEQLLPEREPHATDGTSWDRVPR
jgi:two-component system cell cycle response regulator DivK